MIKVLFFKRLKKIKEFLERIVKLKEKIDLKSWINLLTMKKFYF